MVSPAEHIEAVYRAECERRSTAPSVAMLQALSALQEDQALRRIKVLEARIDAAVDMLHGRLREVERATAASPSNGHAPPTSLAYLPEADP